MFTVETTVALSFGFSKTAASARGSHFKTLSQAKLDGGSGAEVGGANFLHRIRASHAFHLFTGLSGAFQPGSWARGDLGSHVLGGQYLTLDSTHLAHQIQGEIGG
jgi:hypothetical protein